MLYKASKLKDRVCVKLLIHDACSVDFMYQHDFLGRVKSQGLHEI